MRYRLKGIKLDGEDVSVSMDEFDPSPGKRYAFYVNVGNIPSEEVDRLMQQVRDAMDGFFPAGSVLIIPQRGEQRTTEIVELEPIPED